jgi:hypothetical protein
VLFRGTGVGDFVNPAIRPFYKRAVLPELQCPVPADRTATITFRPPAGKQHHTKIKAAVGRYGEKTVKAAPHNSARANSETNRVLMKAVFHRNTLCISRKNDKIRARFFRKAPKADCAVLP